jgi:AcrR family transcriptional regulator
MSTDRKTRAETAAETAARLVAVAAPAFGAQGFAAVSLDQLAAEAGMTRGALHHHFGNKAGLFEAVLRAIVAELGRTLDQVWERELEAGSDTWGAFRQCFHAYLDEALRPDRRRILFCDAPSVLGVQAYDTLMDDGFGTMVEDLRGLVGAGRIAPADPVALAHMMNGAAINLAFWAADAPEGEDRLHEAHQALAAMFDGLTRTAG